MATIIQERVAKRFDRFVDRSGDCWLWTGCIVGGYGTFSINSRSRKAHRVAWEREHGPIPPGLCVCHRCDNPACVRLDHPFLGTVAENNADRAEKGRSKGVFTSDASHPAKQRSGQRHWGAKLSDADVRTIRSRREAGELTRTIAAEFQVNHATVSRIARRVWRGEVA